MMKIDKSFTYSLLSGGLLILFLFGCAHQLKPIKAEKTKPTASQDSSGQYSSDAISHYMEGEIQMQQGNYAMAALEFQEALYYDSTSVTIYNALIRSYLALGKVERAERLLKITLRKFPSNLEAHAAMAQVYLFTRQYDRALQEFEFLTNNAPDEPEYAYRLAEVYLGLNRWKEALSVYKKIYDKDSSQLPAIERAGEIAIRNKDFSTAEELYDILYRENPDDENVLKVLADLASANEHYDKAINLYQQLILKFPDDMETKLRYGQTLIFAKKTRQAINVYSAINEEYPQQRSPYINLSILYTRIEKYDSSLVYLQRGGEKFPDDPVFPYLTGNLYHLQEQDSLAILYLREALKIAPDHYQSLQLLADIFNIQQDYSRSDSLYTVLLEQNPEDDLILNNFSYSLSERGERLEEALEMSKKALKKEPENPAYLDTFGWIYFKLKNFEEALKYVKQSVDIDGANPVVLEHLGDILRELSRDNEAVIYYRKALELDPGNTRLQQKIDRVQSNK